MSFADLLTGNRLVRWAADNMLARFSRKRTRRLDDLDAGAVQAQALLSLVHTARGTRFGKEHGFESIRSVADYQRQTPVRDYEAFWTQYWQPAFPRIDDITWPGFIPYFALSSGTTSGSTKNIPISHEMLKSNRKAAFTTLAFYRNVFPNERLFNGRVFFLGGNTGMTPTANGNRSGDLSAIAAVEVSSLLRPYAFPPLQLAGIGDWDTKLRLLAEQSAQLPVTVFSGVPSWQLRLFDKLKAVTGKATIAEIWPTLRVVVHGGTSFDPYRDVFRREIGSDRVRFIEVYPCSEGFVATEDPRYDLLRIVPDHEIFFEFVPLSDFDEQHGKLKSDFPIRHTLANVEVGVQYAVLVTSCAGLWSYLVGDTIAFEKRSPPLIRFTGRTKFFLSAFGEHLIAEEIEKAIMRASAETGAEAQDHHVGPLFPSGPQQPGRHLYLIEFRKKPDDLDRFARVVDEELSRLNEDYAAHRQGDLTMLAPTIAVVRQGGFEGWLRSRPNFSPQHKVPRMDNTGKVTTAIQTWLREHGFLN